MGENSIFYFIDAENVQKVGQAKQLGLDLNACNENDIPPLYYALKQGASLEMIEALLENGADIHWRNSEGVAILDIAIETKRSDVVERLLKQGVNAEETSRGSGMTPLMVAACYNQLKMIELLLNNGACLETADVNGMTAADYARRTGQRKAHALLLSKMESQ